MDRTRILLVMPSMRGGGAERVIASLLGHFDSAQLDLHLALVTCEGPYLKQLPDEVTVHDLRARRVARSLVPLARLIHQLRPDTVLSSNWHMNLAVAAVHVASPRHTRLVLRETALSRQILQSTRSPRLLGLLYHQLYRRADAVICQSEFMRHDLYTRFHLPGDRLVVLPNPVDIQLLNRLAESGHPGPISGTGPHLVTLGSLQKIKGTHRVLDALPTLLGRHPNAQLWVLGQGPRKQALQHQATSLGIGAHIHFVGFQQNPYRWLRAAGALVIASDFESAPNVLLESVACGCPPIVLRHPGGTEQLMRQLGLTDRWIQRLDDWHDAWFAPLDSGSRQRLLHRHSAPNVARQYMAVLLGRAIKVSGNRIELERSKPIPAVEMPAGEGSVLAGPRRQT